MNTFDNVSSSNVLATTGMWALSLAPIRVADFRLGASPHVRCSLVFLRFDLLTTQASWQMPRDKIHLLDAPIREFAT
jgi:hypothetical protein